MSSAVAEAPVAFAISPITQKILKNFSSIADALVLSPGTTQRTVLQSMSVFAVAELPEPWPTSPQPDGVTAIYNLNLFVGAISSFDKPTLTYGKDAMLLTQDAPGAKLTVKYRYSDATTIEAVPTKILPNDNEAVSFTMSSYTMNTIKKMASLLKLTHFVVTASKNGVQFTADDPKIPNSHQFSIDLVKSDVTINDGAFKRSMRFQLAHFAYLMDGDYDVRLSAWKYAYFVNKNTPVSYYIAEDKDI
jgi:hypothetical protein